MGFSTAVLLLALVHAGVGLASARRTATLRHAVLAALGGAAASTLAGILVMRVGMAGFGFFALAHVGYLAITVTVPSLAIAGWTARVRGARSYLDRRTAATVLTVGLFPALVGVYATHIEPSRLRVDHHDLEAEHVDAPIRIGIFADLQTPRIGDYEQHAVRRILAEEPDILLVPGDLWQMADGEIRARWPDFRALVEQMTAAVDHVVIVEGDTDDAGWLRTVTAGTGAHLLENGSARLSVAGTEVLVAGLLNDDNDIDPDQEREPGRSAAVGALGDAPAGTFTILLAHRPDVVLDPAVRRAAPDLVVAGHTHGGQIQLPFIGPLVTFSDVPRDVAAGGLHRVDDVDVYVSTGIGVERQLAPQVRFGVRPSVGIIDVASPSG